MPLKWENWSCLQIHFPKVCFPSSGATDFQNGFTDTREVHFTGTVFFLYCVETCFGSARLTSFDNCIVVLGEKPKLVFLRKLFRQHAHSHFNKFSGLISARQYSSIVVRFGFSKMWNSENGNFLVICSLRASRRRKITLDYFCLVTHKVLQSAKRHEASEFA